MRASATLDGMRILIASDWYAPVINGVVTSVMNLERELRAAGHEVRILTLSDSIQSSRTGHVTYLGSLPAGEIYPEARVALIAQARFVSELVEWGPDVVHTQAEFSTFRVARRIASKLGIPVVHSYHTVYEDYTHYFSPSKRAGRAAVAMLTKEALRRIECVIVPSEKIRDLLLGYGVKSPITVIPSGIDLSRYDTPRDEVAIARLRERLGIPAHARVLVSVGRIAKEKNLEEVVDFHSRIADPDLFLVIVGDGPHRPALVEHVKRAGAADRVVFTGMIAPEDVPLHYRVGDVFVSASNSETQGLSYIEALAAGTPALCRKDDCLEHVLFDGENGWQYTDFEGFATRLAQMLSDSDLHAHLSSNARTLAVRDYGARSFAERVHAQYEKAATARKLKDRGPFLHA